MRRRTAELVHAYVRFADQIAVALADETFTARDYLVRAKADTIRLTATPLLAVGAQRRVWEQRMGHLLLGSPRTRRATNEKDNQPGQAFPGGEIYLSFPGLGDRLAARVAGEIGEHIEQFDSPNALACYAGKAPVTRRSEIGKQERASQAPASPRSAEKAGPTASRRRSHARDVQTAGPASMSSTNRGRRAGSAGHG